MQTVVRWLTFMKLAACVVKLEFLNHLCDGELLTVLAQVISKTDGGGYGGF